MQVRIYKGMIKHQASVRKRKKREVDKLKNDLNEMLEERSRLEHEILRSRMEVDRKHDIIRQYQMENDRIREIKKEQERADLEELLKEKENQRLAKAAQYDLILGVEERLELDAEIHFLTTKLDAYLKADRPLSVGKAKQGLIAKGGSKLSTLDEDIEQESSSQIFGRQRHRFSLYDVNSAIYSPLSRRFSKI